MIDFYFIRHAESEKNNEPNVIGGQSNESPLSENGKQQSALLGKRFLKENIRFDSIYASTARRAQETSTIVAELLNYPATQIQLSDELLELSQGEWENQLRTKIYTPETRKKINSDNWNFTPPGGESQRQVEERMLNWTNKIIQQSKTNTTIGVISHGMAIKCLLRGIMNFNPTLTYKLILDNTAIARLIYSESGWSLVTFNDAGHLIGRGKLNSKI